MWRLYVIASARPREICCNSLAALDQYRRDIMNVQKFVMKKERTSQHWNLIIKNIDQIWKEVVKTSRHFELRATWSSV